MDTGTYVENINFNGKNIVVGSLFITTGDTSYVSLTVIDGNNHGSVVTFENGEDSTAVLSGFTITNGYDSQGGGIYCDNSSPRLMNLIIRGNHGSYGGGGISCWYSSSPGLFDVIISGNKAAYGGGINCVSSSLSLVNVTISDNNASNGGGISCNSSTLSLKNTILWNDSEPEILGPSSIAIAYSDVEGGKEGIVNNNGTLNWLEGNIDTDPLFCNPDSGDYSLAVNSPCVGTGENGANIGAWGIGCGALGIDNGQVGLPISFELHQNYPNPFNPVTNIKYGLKEDSYVSLKIYNLMGQEVRTLVNEHQPAAFHTVRWDGKNKNGVPVPNGVYIYRITAHTPNGTSFVKSQKMILLK